MSNKNRFNVQEAQNLQLGQRGWTYIGDTDSHSGVWVKIIFLTDTVFTTLTDANGSGTLTGVTFPAGREIVGNFTVIDLASGSIWALKG